MSELFAVKVSFGYGRELPLLNEINLSVRGNELIAILGGNGAGKTTLLRLLSGLLAPTEGRIGIQTDDGIVFEARGRVGIVFQNPDHQMIAPTVEEELALGLEMRGMPPELMRPKITAMLEQFALQPLRQRPPEALSGGQKQRVALAAAMITDPLFMLFDEPDSFLDGASRRELLRSVERIRGRCGMIWVTPAPRRLPPADRFFQLTGGRLSESTEQDILSLVSCRAA